MSRPPIVTRPVTTGKMPRYLVTGGAGFIGSHVVDALAARGAAVRVVDDLSTGRRGNLAGHPDVELIEADLADARVAEAAVTGVECAIHMAAIPSVPRSVQEPRRARRANVDATRALLLAARDAGVRRVVLASSSSVYGESSALPNREALRPPGLHCRGSGRADHQHCRRRSSVGERRVRDAAADHRRIGHAALRRTSAGRRTAFAGRRVARPRSAGLRSRRAGRRRTAASGRLAAGAGQPRADYVVTERPTRLAALSLPRPARRTTVWNAGTEPLGVVQLCHRCVLEARRFARRGRRK